MGSVIPLKKSANSAYLELKNLLGGKLEKVENLIKAAPALENPGEVKQMAMKDEDVFAALRRRLPQEITDDVVRLIAYNPEAFADFADISDQSDVDSFNEKYNVQLVLPVENVT